ncbi:hypothetical protein BS47DRAFT_1344864 [Hydnum rufescens UP504]|uniref:DNA polymerase n=1 Tax=Hydnum rufescens UP504 TaxID=1448309 RepID=A0A9P6AVY3_9AGAM|nr:hypothetical protein BS47DRAFT_1344864 [Hydnum rufescens UP504]
MHWRFLEGGELSYSRSISWCKCCTAYPRVVRSSKEVVDLPGLGPKLFKMIDEFLKDGEIKEARRAINSPRFGVLSLFSTIYGIGPSTARRLYDQGNRTFEDLERYYNEWERKNGKPSGMREALVLRDDLAQKIPRAEVEEMVEAICKHLDSIQEGFQHTMCGGYRRGKEYSNDVDIVFSRPGIDPKQDRGMCQALVTRLQEAGLVTHVMLLSSFTSQHSPFSRFSTSSQGIDTLDTALTVFKFHGEGRVHRRLDLIFAPWNVYWTAVVGWTGSTQFERDLRIWAKQERGMKFDCSGITRVHNSEQVFVHSEEEVFQVLGLPWIDPTMRNANA